jgi:CRISPR/Cas system-associated exonuclease Cas4 (RecB family)
MNKISFSAITTVASCKRAGWYFLNNKPTEHLPPEETTAGKKMHKIMKTCIEIWDFQKMVDLTGNNPMSLFLKWKGLKPEFENKMTIEFEDYTLTTIPDILFPDKQILTIMDMKNNRMELMETDEIQLELYAYALLSKNPLLTIPTCVYAIQQNRIYEGITYTLADKEKIESHLREWIKEVEECKTEKNPKPTISSFCYWCSFSGTCAKEKFLPTPIISSEEQARAVLESIVINEEAIGKQKKLLDGYCEVNNLVIIAGKKQAGYFPSNKTVLKEFEIIKGILLPHFNPFFEGTKPEIVEKFMQGLSALLLDFMNIDKKQAITKAMQEKYPTFKKNVFFESAGNKFTIKAAPKTKGEKNA